MKGASAAEWMEPFSPDLTAIKTLLYGAVSFFLDPLDQKCVCVHVHIFYSQGYLQKVLSRRSYFSDLLAVFLLATVCAQLSHFGSSSRLWGQSPGIGGDDQMTFGNTDEVLPPIPSPSPPFPGSQLWNKEGKKQQYDESQQLPLQTQAGGWGLTPSVSLFCYLPCPFPQGRNKTEYF